MKKSVSFFWFFIIYLLVKKIVIYNHHGKAVLAFALGLRLALVNNFKPSEEEERKCVVLSLKIIYRNHGKAVLAFCRAWKTSLYLVFFI